MRLPHRDPSRSQVFWMYLLSITFGFCFGVSAVTFIYAKGTSYLFDDPKVCMNCHIMREQFDGWNRSTHKGVATCKGCHSPDDILGAVVVKGVNGAKHSTAFTLGGYPEPILIKSFNRAVVRANCRRCHQDVGESMTVGYARRAPECISCHGNVGHANRY